MKQHWLSPEAFQKWKESRNFCNRLNYHKNLNYQRKRSQNYQINNPHKGAARSAKRKAVKLQATPNWLLPKHIEKIEEFYFMAKELEKIFPWKQEVDHIEPLQGKDVCGLHVPWNLQILPMSTNRSKGIKRGV